MLRLVIPMSPEEWDENKEEFVSGKTQVLQLEHSLVSISKWESEWRKSFLNTRNKTPEETISYVKCMTVNSNVDPEVYSRLTREHFQAINDYINHPMTATTFREDKNRRPNRQIVTAELIYYWMTVSNIPFDREKWHINRLLTLIRVCNEENAPKKKRSQREIIAEQAALNAARRQKLNKK